MALDKLGSLLKGQWNTWSSYERNLDKHAPNVSQYVAKNFPLRIFELIMPQYNSRKDRYYQAIQFFEKNHPPNKPDDAIGTDTKAALTNEVDSQVSTSICSYLGGFEFIRKLPSTNMPGSFLEKGRAIAEAEPYEKNICDILRGISTYLSLFSDIIGSSDNERLLSIADKIEKRDAKGAEALRQIIMQTQQTKSIANVPQPNDLIKTMTDDALRYLKHMEQTFDVVVPFKRPEM